MGTFYSLCNEKKNTINISGEFGIDEMSNRLAFVYCAEKVINPWCSSEEMKPEEMAKILLEGLTVCSYWMAVDDLKQIIKNHVEKEIW